MANSIIPPFEILLVEDEPGDIDLIKIALAEGRFICHVTTAMNGVEAMDILNKAPGLHDNAPTPDLVLLDLNMPLMNGKEVLKAMKADPKLARIPVVVLTTSDVERDVLASYDLGAAGFVTKPLDMEQLFRAIHGVEEYWFGVVRCPGHNHGPA
ncbi:MAG: response regulator [Alphaproteobacteria bacterium]|nr:response regulator [Alphaproteobacteria bacterium]MBF0333581.1 response regulator [Alphaproteobacteria bacterium]